MSRSRAYVALLIILISIGAWLGLPLLERSFAPQVTVAALHAHPEQFMHQMVYVRGVLQWIGTNTCRIPGPAFIVVADAPVQIMVTENQPLPTNAIRVPIEVWERLSLAEQQNQEVIVWGRIQQQEVNVLSCPGDPPPNPSTEHWTYFYIERIQLADGRVLP